MSTQDLGLRKLVIISTVFLHIFCPTLLGDIFHLKELVISCAAKCIFFFWGGGGISFRLGQQVISLMCLSVPFVIMLSAPTITNIMVVSRGSIFSIYYLLICHTSKSISLLYNLFISTLKKKICIEHIQN